MLRYWEDVAVGETFVAGPHEVTEEAVIRFASKFDPQYFHVDAEAAKKGPFGTLTASGWHSGSISMRLLVEGVLTTVRSQGAPGVRMVRWLKPVTPGMQLSLHTEVLKVFPSKSRRNIGFVDARHMLRNADGTDMLHMENIFMISRRPEADASGEGSA